MKTVSLWRHPTLLALAAAILLGAPRPAVAACDLKVRSLGAVVLHAGLGNDYDPFSSTPQIVIEEFDVEHRGDPCEFFVTFSTGQSGSFDRRMRRLREELEYQIYATASLQNVLKDLPHALPNEVISGSFGAGRSTRRLQFAVALAPRQLAPRGPYFDRVVVTAYEGTLNDHVQRDERSMLVLTRIRPAVQISLVPAGGAFDPGRRTHYMDLGVLVEGRTARADLLVRNNTWYRVLIESENRGVLRHVDPAVPEGIPYAMRLGGLPVNLDRQERLLGVSRVSPLEGERYPIAITVGRVEGAESGTYRDNITITVRAH